MKNSVFFQFLRKISLRLGFEKKKTIHHIALGTESVLEMANFYAKIPGLRKEKEFLYEGQERLRSVWILAGSTRIMIEDGKKQAPRALVFPLQRGSHWREFLETQSILDRTQFTIYFKDTDGNRLGVSNYPEAFPDWGRNI